MSAKPKLGNLLEADRKMVDAAKAAARPAAPGVNPAAVAKALSGQKLRLGSILWSSKIWWEAYSGEVVEVEVPNQRPFDIVAVEREFGASIAEVGERIDVILWMAWRAMHRHKNPNLCSKNIEFEEWAERVDDYEMGFADSGEGDDPLEEDGGEGTVS